MFNLIDEKKNLIHIFFTHTMENNNDKNYNNYTDFIQKTKKEYNKKRDSLLENITMKPFYSYSPRFYAIDTNQQYFIKKKIQNSVLNIEELNKRRYNEKESLTPQQKSIVEKYKNTFNINPSTQQPYLDNNTRQKRINDWYKEFLIKKKQYEDEVLSQQQQQTKGGSGSKKNHSSKFLKNKKHKKYSKK
jgi:hypothetical protein